MKIICKETQIYISEFFSLYQMDTEEFQFDEDYVIACEEFDAGGRDAVLLTFDSRTVYDKTAYVIFDDLQYVAEVSMGKEITTDEAKKIAEGITLTSTEKEKMTKPASTSSYVFQKRTRMVNMKTNFSNRNMTAFIMNRFILMHRIAVPIQIIIISLQQLEEEKALSVTWDTWSMKICLARFIWIQIIVMK